MNEIAVSPAVGNCAQGLPLLQCYVSPGSCALLSSLSSKTIARSLPPSSHSVLAALPALHDPLCTNDPVPCWVRQVLLLFGKLLGRFLCTVYSNANFCTQRPCYNSVFYKTWFSIILQLIKSWSAYIWEEELRQDFHPSEGVPCGWRVARRELPGESYQNTMDEAARAARAARARPRWQVMPWGWEVAGK